MRTITKVIICFTWRFFSSRRRQWWGKGQLRWGRRLKSISPTLYEQLFVLMGTEKAECGLLIIHMKSSYFSLPLYFLVRFTDTGYFKAGHSWSNSSFIDELGKGTCLGWHFLKSTLKTVLYVTENDLKTALFANLRPTSLTIFLLTILR